MTHKLSDHKLGFSFTERLAGGFVRVRLTHPRTPDGREAETAEERAQWRASDAGKVARIRNIADKSLKDARAAFEEAFGVKPTDKTIDFALTSELSEAVRQGQPLAKLLLPLWLRRGGRPAGRIGLSDLTYLMTRARQRKREIMDEYPVGHVNHVKAPAAEQMVAQEFLTESGLTTVKRFVEVMKRRKLWKPETRKRARQGNADLR